MPWSLPKTSECKLGRNAVEPGVYSVADGFSCPPGDTGVAEKIPGLV